MATFDNVNYTYYSATLGRSVVPNETTFNSYKLEEVAYMRTLLPLISSEREENGIDKATCLFIEEAYTADQTKTADGRIETSRSLDGYSQSFDVTHAQTSAEKRIKWLRLFCEYSTGVF